MRSMAFFMVSKTVSAAISALVLLKPVRLTTQVTMVVLDHSFGFGGTGPPFALSRISVLAFAARTA